MFQRILFIAFSLLALTVTAAAQDGSWNVKGIAYLDEMIEEFDPNAALAPDGSALAWTGREAICVWKPGMAFMGALLGTATAHCTPYPENFRANAQHPPVWSPDGRYLAMTSNFFQMFHEPDIMLYDIEARTYTNLTDDGSDRSFLPGMEDSEKVDLDVLPTFHPLTGEIYFLRINIREEDYTLHLYKIGVEGGEPEEVYDLTDELPKPFPISLKIAFSPDGSRLALPVQAPRYENPANGLWILDLEADRLRFVANMFLLHQGMPEARLKENGPTMFLVDLEWADNDAVVVAMVEMVHSALHPMQNFYYVDVEAKTTTPIFDFTELTDPEELITGEDEAGRSGVYALPRSGMITPDTFFYFHNDISKRGDAGISAVPLPPDTSEPLRLYEWEDYKPWRGGPEYLSQVTDGKAFTFSRLLVQFEEERGSGNE